MVNWACLDRAPLCVAVLLGARSARAALRLDGRRARRAAAGAPSTSGQAYPAESAVQHVYEYDSSREPDGAFPISLAITWEAGWHLATRRGDRSRASATPPGWTRRRGSTRAAPAPAARWSSSPQPYQVIQVRTVRLD